MSMGLQRNISGSTTRLFTGLLERHRFCVLDLIEKIEALAGDSSVGVHDNSTDERTRTDLANTAPCLFQGARHHLAICLGLLLQFHGVKSVPPALAAGRICALTRGSH